MSSEEVQRRKGFRAWPWTVQVLVIVVGLFVILGIVTAIVGGGNDEPVSSNTSVRRFELCGLAEQFVKDRLKAPSTAKFQSCEDRSVSGAGPYTVRGWVDSENSFGAMLRSNYSVTLTAIGDDRYRASDISLTER